MTIEIVSSGLQTSVQDMGRQGLMHIGVSSSGAMDLLSMQLANWLVGNPQNASVLEITLTGPHLRFHCPLIIAVVGAPFVMALNGESITTGQSYSIQAGDELVIGQTTKGCRAYLAFSAQLQIPQVFSSQSTHLTAAYGGMQGRALQNGTQLPLSPRDRPQSPVKKLATEYQFNLSGHYLIRCVEGVEATRFSPDAVEVFYHQQWRVTPHSNRMGIRLQGESVPGLPTEDMVSSGLLPGSIQLPPSGLPIISAKDGQTIGGYPRIAHVIKADLPLLGQLKPGDTVSFKQISHGRANQFYQQQQFLLKRLMGFEVTA